MIISPAWSPDGKYIVFTQGSAPKYWMYNQTHLAIVPAEGGKTLTLAKELDRDVSRPKFSKDGKSVRFFVADNRHRYLAEISISEGKVKRLLSESYVINRVSEGNGHTAVVATSDHLPAEVYARRKGAFTEFNPP